MPRYRIPCTWQMSGEYVVEAASLEDAEDIAKVLPLPTDGEYVEDSWVMDKEHPDYGEEVK